MDQVSGPHKRDVCKLHFWIGLALFRISLKYFRNKIWNGIDEYVRKISRISYYVQQGDST